MEKMLIRSVCMEENDGGIIRITVDTNDVCSDCGINWGPKGKLELVRRYDTEIQPGCFEETEEKEAFDVGEYHTYKYYLLNVTYFTNQLIILLIPRMLLTSPTGWRKI